MLWNSWTRRMVVPELRDQRVDGPAQHARCLARIDGQLLIDIPQLQAPVAEGELQLAMLEHAAVLVAEDRQQQSRRQFRLHRRQSMSKNAAAGEPGPFSSTSFHHALRAGPMPM